MTAKRLLAAYADWRARGEALVLATVYETKGSTYSKAGAQMLIAGNGNFQGMLSGGCLEGDLGARAREVLRTGSQQTVTYDLGQNDEELWGLGVGCDGLIRIFLQPLLPASNYQPFAAMAEALSGDETHNALTVVSSQREGLAGGVALVTVAGDTLFSSIPDEYLAALVDAAIPARPASLWQLRTLDIDGSPIEVLTGSLRPPPRVLILGAGLDAEPVARLVDELGWRATVQDHRPAYIENGDFASAEQVLCVPAADLANTIDLDRYDAAIVMSHHLVTDREYLKALSRSRIASIGLLGPRERSKRLIDDLGELAADLGDRVQGPAGIDIGARGPAAIALSIVAQMYIDIATGRT